jgi:hypothetical protein
VTSLEWSVRPARGGPYDTGIHLVVLGAFGTVSCDCRPGIGGLHPLMSIVRRLTEVGSMDPKLYRTAVIVLMVAQVIIGVMTLCN